MSFEDQVELGLRAGLFGEPLPDRLGMLSSMVNIDDPLAPLDGVGLAQASYESVARLVVVERLIGGGGASRVEHFVVGPAHSGRRPVELAWRETLYAQTAPARREISGWRRET